MVWGRADWLVSVLLFKYIENDRKMSISAFVQSEKLARFHVYNGSSGFKIGAGSKNMNI